MAIFEKPLWQVCQLEGWRIDLNPTASGSEHLRKGRLLAHISFRKIILFIV